MAKNVKKSFGKSSLRLSSMFLAVLMLVSTMFTGITTTAASAETFGGNTIKVADNAAGAELGQIVELEAGKTYVFSYYFSGPSFATGLILDGDGAGNTTFTATRTIYDEVYNKVTYEFVAPANATAAEEDGKVKIYLGMYVPTKNIYYFYHPSVYAADDATKTNLFYDYEFMGKYAIEGSDGVSPNWYRKYSGVLGYRFTKWSVGALGGLDFFKKTEDEICTIKLSANSNSSYAFFGQHVELEAGKTYILSNCYTDDNLGFRVRYTDSETNGTVDISTADTINYDNDYFRKNVTFTVPTTAVVDENGKTSAWVGIQCWKRTYEVYYYDFKLYDIENPQVNLFKDYALLENGSNLTNVWCRPSGKLYTGYYYRATLTEAGGINGFKKTDADRYVIKLEAGKESKNTYIGQHVELEAGKTYFVSTCYTGDNFGHAFRKTGTYTTLPNIGSSYDNDAFRKTTAFTVPIDEGETEGTKKSMWVGVACYSVSEPIYLYDFRLYAPENPEINLYNDYALLNNGASIDSVWCHPSKALVSDCFSKVRPSEAGGTEVFYKTDADRKVLKLEANTTGQPYFGQFISLEAGKTYVFSNYYLPGAEAIQKICYSGTNELETEIISDKDYSKQGVKFTVPADAPDDGNGKKKIWVGFRGQNLEYPIYYYDLKLYDVELPQINLLADSNLYSGGGAVHYNTWKTPSNNATSAAFSLITLEDIGGIEYFMAFSKKCDVTLDEKIDIRDLVRLKKFSVGTVETLPENRGDLNGDFTTGNAADLILLKKEIIK